MLTLWWLIVIIIILLCVLAYTLVTLFSSVGKRPNAITGTPIVTGSDEFLAALSALTGAAVDKGNEVTMLENGDEIFPAMFAAMKAAKHHIHLMTFIWADGKLSDQLLSLLIEKAHEGVEIRVFLDSLGGFYAPEDKFKVLQAAGGVVAWFSRFEFGKLSRYLRRNHRRSIVIDGKTAFTGGMSISDEWLGHAQSPKNWRDNMFEVTGTMALRLQAAFVQMWSGSTGEILVGNKYFPAVKGRGTVPFISIASSPSDVVHPIRSLLWMSFMGAQRQILLENPYFVPDHHILAVLKARAMAGVDVRVMVPNELIDVPPVLWAGRYYYEELLTAGVRIFEYQKTMLHSKFIVVDDVWSVIGSANIDIRSKELNEENVLAVKDDVLANELSVAFNNDCLLAKEIRLREWRKRSLWWRFREAFAALFSEQF
ncbi:TPA: cardiolipin synthase [Candidatus Uhrbacteria bacterium]|nr:cardiolipin synthase [Candidatus Uhrbacteria bacterium]